MGECVKSVLQAVGRYDVVRHELQRDETLEYLQATSMEMAPFQTSHK